jgi:hypothetical protein
MVEFAVILPVLAMLVVGVVEIGFAFKEKLLVDNAIQVPRLVARELFGMDVVSRRPRCRGDGSRCHWSQGLFLSHLDHRNVSDGR